MATNIIDISQVNIEGLMRDMGEKEAMRLLKQVIENNIMILNYKNSYWNYKKQQSRKEEENRKQKGREGNITKDGRKKNKKEKEEEKERKRLDDEQKK